MFVSIARQLIGRNCIGNWSKNLKTQHRLVSISLVKLLSSKTGNENIVDFSKSNIDFSQFKFDKEKQKLIISFEEELADLIAKGERVCNPYDLKENDWEDILDTRSKTARRHCYDYLFIKTNRKKANKRKREQQADAQRNERHDGAIENTHIKYGLGQTTLIPRITKTVITNWKYHNFLLSKQFGSKIIIDCSYDIHMERKETKNCAEQISKCIAINRSHTNPFDLHICYNDFEGLLMTQLRSFHPNMRNQKFPGEVHQKDVTDIFSRDKLVYLTPHCDNDLEEFSPDDIYIIGGVVDKRHSYPMSLEKATTMGLRMARFPLDKYFRWKSGRGKCLALDQVLKIMLDLKSGQDWKEALRHVPKRIRESKVENSLDHQDDYIDDTADSGEPVITEIK